MDYPVRIHCPVNINERLIILHKNRLYSFSQFIISKVYYKLCDLYSTQSINNYGYINLFNKLKKTNGCLLLRFYVLRRILFNGAIDGYRYILKID
jgi:hypothetical protein